ncbi:radical SAM protein [Salinibacterium sp.]|uniref:radical SAM protein n=1 Tax=Salinibacterium sp. TaxID=1915057 RepID=UPI00286ADF9B|nr:radical SAM protein [Salinibacterium sp.]
MTSLEMSGAVQPGNVPTPAGLVTELIDGGQMDCGSGLLLLITRAMRRLQPGQSLGVRSSESSVTDDLPVWAELVGHGIISHHEESAEGPWWFVVQKAEAVVSTVFTQGDRTPVGQRLWVYTNFDCNLACTYCCAESSPRAASRRVEPAMATAVFDEFRALGGKEVLLTGGEPFMHPELGELVSAADGLSVTILTNAMIFGKGRRRETLESLDREVTLQVSLDSATPELHDAQRGRGSWARALDGIGLAHSLGFRVRVAATLYDEDPTGVAELHRRLDTEGIAADDRLIRPVAQEGFAETGMHVSVSTLEPEPTITADGAWWHPVAVTNPNMKIADSPLPLSEVFGVVNDTMRLQDAAARTGREVFRCA